MKERHVSMKKGLVLFLLLALLVSVFATSHAQPVSAANTTYTVSGTKNYLALRSSAKYSKSNEIGKLYNGDTVTVSSTKNSSYWYVYSSKLNKNGYVNKKYLTASTASSSNTSASSSNYTVKGTKNYLALRSAAKYSASNAIGKLYNGDTVTVKDSSGSKYWYVYSSKLNKSGYVNKSYLTSSTATASSTSTNTSNTTGSSNYTVSGTKNYLALRSAAKYSASNEIGKLSNGETVTVKTKSGSYWYVYSPKLGKSGYVNSKYLKK